MALLFLYADTRAFFDASKMFLAHERAIAWEFRRIEIDAITCAVRVSFFLEFFDKGNLLRDVISCLRIFVGRQDMEFTNITQKKIRIIGSKFPDIFAGGLRSLFHFVFAGVRIIGEMPDVRNIHDMFHTQAIAKQRTFQKIFEHKRTQVTNVHEIVHGRPAGVERDRAGFARPEKLFRAGKRVENSDCHSGYSLPFYTAHAKLWYTFWRMSFFSKSIPRVLGVDIGAGGVKLVELEKSSTRPKLFTYGYGDGLNQFIHKRSDSAEMEQQAIQLHAQRLRAVYDAAGAKAMIASASLPVSQVFSVVVRVPEADKEEVRKTAEAQASKLMQYPIEDIVLDTRIMEERIADLSADKKKAKTREVLVIATLRKIVERYSSIFAQAHITLDSLESEAFGLIRSLVGNDPSTAMVIDIGSERTNFFMVERGIPRTQRSIELGGMTFTSAIQDILDVEMDQAEQIKKDLSRSENPEAQRIVRSLLERSLQPIVKEVEYGFMLFSEQVQRENSRPEKIILTGGSSGIPQLTEMLEDHFKIKTYIGDPWARVVYPSQIKPVLDSIGPRFSVALGLALRLAM